MEGCSQSLINDTIPEFSRIFASFMAHFPPDPLTIHSRVQSCKDRILLHELKAHRVKWTLQNSLIKYPTLINSNLFFS